MANIPASGASARSQHATLAAGVVDVVTLDQAYPRITVINRSTTDWLWFTVDRGNANQTTLTPTVAGPGCYPVGPGGVWNDAHDDINRSAGTLTPSVIRIISPAAVPYSAIGTNVPNG